MLVLASAMSVGGKVASSPASLGVLALASATRVGGKVASAIATGDPAKIALTKLERNQHHNSTRTERLQHYRRREQAMSLPDDCQ